MGSARDTAKLFRFETGDLSSNGFYGDIQAFEDFAGIADLDNYHRAPDDWQVIIADVVGSTSAIAEGRYKDVNMIGASCINAVLNISQQTSIPYVFGGDGATLMVPPGQLQNAAEVLLGVRALAASEFDLKLRVGVVPVAQIHAHPDARVMVGKYRLSEGNELGVFSGRGIDLAEQWIKSSEQYLLQHSPLNEAPDLSGLSCRWQPLASQNGIMLSLLMQARAESDTANADLYRGLIAEIAAITEAGGVAVKPVCDANCIMASKSSPFT